jgi:O-antigen/teichoic acid export membrane protein
MSLAPDNHADAALPVRYGWRSALAAMSLLWIATVAGAGMSFLTQTLLARELGPAEFGMFVSSLATVTMVAPMAGFGLSQFWLKAYGTEGWAADRWLRPSLRFITLTTLTTLLAIAAWALLGAPSGNTRITLLILLPVVLSVLAVDLVGSKLRLEERYGAFASWQMAIPFSRLMVATSLIVFPIYAGRLVAWGYCAISLGVVVLATPHLRAMMHNGLRLHGHGPRPVTGEPAELQPATSQLLSRAWAYGMAAVLYPIFFQVSTVLLKYLDDDTQAGMFGIALAVMTAIYLIPATLYQKFLLSKLHRWAAHDQRKFWRTYRLGNAAMLAAGVVVGVLMVALSPWLVPLVFGGKYLPVVKILMVLALCPPIRFLSTGVGSALLSEKHMRYRAYAMSAAAAIVIVLNFLLIPRFHVLGAAVATVIGEAVLLLSFYIGVRGFYASSR